VEQITFVLMLSAGVRFALATVLAVALLLDKRSEVPW
jgi:hypothetical protein